MPMPVQTLRCGVCRQKFTAVRGAMQLRGGGACMPLLKPVLDQSVDLEAQLLRASSVGNTDLVLDPHIPCIFKFISCMLVFGAF